MSQFTLRRPVGEVGEITDLPLRSRTQTTLVRTPRGLASLVVFLLLRSIQHPRCLLPLSRRNASVNSPSSVLSVTTARIAPTIEGIAVMNFRSVFSTTALPSATNCNEGQDVNDGDQGTTI